MTPPIVMLACIFVGIGALISGDVGSLLIVVALGIALTACILTMIRP